MDPKKFEDEVVLKMAAEFERALEQISESTLTRLRGVGGASRASVLTACIVYSMGESLIVAKNGIFDRIEELESRVSALEPTREDG